MAAVVTSFGAAASAPEEPSRAALGNKGANLVRLAAAGFPVPPGFVLPTEVCRRELAGGAPELPELVASGLAALQQATGKTFGARRRPLLVSVRSGAPVSMPGMLDTVLDVGLTEDVLSGLVRATGNPRMAWDAFRRLVQGYAGAVHHVPAEPFEALLAERLARERAASERELDATALRELTAEFLGAFDRLVGQRFPTDPVQQLLGAVRAVFRSWAGARARAYRRHHGIDDGLGTAVVVQAMAFGNAGGTSGSGVAFTRDPGTGAPGLYADFLFDAQGEDVVSGRRAAQDLEALRRAAPELVAGLERTAAGLERLFADAQDFEFTVEAGALHLLQSRAAQRTPWAALRMAVDMVGEGLIDPATALERLGGVDLERVSRTRLSRAPGPAAARGTPASPGVAVGLVALDSAAAQARAAAGEAVVLVRGDTSTSDLPGMLAARGVLTAAGGRTAHAAVVARQLGRPCVVGCGALVVAAGKATLGGAALAPGDPISIDGATGEVYLGAVEVAEERPAAELEAVRRWRAAGGR